MLHTGAEGVTYMSLAPVSAIAVFGVAKIGGAGLQLGIEVKVLVTREVLTLLSLEIIELCPIADPCCQVKAYQPWFFGFAGACWIRAGCSVHVSGYIVLVGAAGVLVAYSTAVGGAQPSNDTAIFYR